MIRFTRWAVGMVAFSVSVGAFAQESDPVAEPAPAEATPAPAAVGDANAGVSTDSGAASKKFKLGLRLGYALPMGDTAKDSKLGDAVSGQVPIWIDAGYMVTPNILLGLYGQYGFVGTKNCDSCSAHDLRIGIQGQYHISPAEGVDPWVGLGIGYESLSASQKNPLTGGDIDSGVSGFEFLNLQGGADFKVTDAFSVGPFLSFSLGQFSKTNLNGTSQDITDKAIHEWFTFGAKGTFGL